MTIKQRVLIGSLTATLSFIGAIKMQEGFTPTPVIPTKGDVPTIGHGTTIYPNGKRVTLHDKPITRETADYYLRQHASKDERQLKKSIPNVKLTQNEYDVYLDFVYQYGIDTFNKSSIRTNLLQGQYTQACKSILKYRFMTKPVKRDCSIRSNKCYGVWTRQQARVKKCLS